ncbi:MAG TPA: hypothetical protein VEZ44_04685 [bacterium]|nr:hypothetical protein [bacterium]
MYEAESSERRTIGSVSVTGGGWWSAALTVPITDPGAAFLHVERRGDLPAGYRGGEDAASLAMPVGEVDAVVALLVGLIRHAQADGVLPGAGASEPAKRVRERPSGAPDAYRVPRVGDRVYWAGDVTRRRREGTVSAVYDDPRGATFGLVFDVRWDPPIPGDREPWAGTSRGLPVSQLRRPGWGWVEERGKGGGAVREKNHARARAMLFPLGRVLATRGALCALQTANAEPLHYLARHVAGDWGDLDAEDRAANEHALCTGERLLSAYQLADGQRLWLITEADRSATTILLPDEY